VDLSTGVVVTYSEYLTFYGKVLGTHTEYAGIDFTIKEVFLLTFCV